MKDHRRLYDAPRKHYVTGKAAAAPARETSNHVRAFALLPEGYAYYVLASSSATYSTLE